MDIADAATYFDEDQVLDGYSGAVLFLGHTMPHDDSTSSGATSRRRTLSAGAAAAAPARGVITLYGERWLISANNVDSFRGSNVRQNFDLKKSTGLMAKLTPAQACNSAVGTEFYAHKQYFRDMENGRTEAEWDTMWNIFCPASESVDKGDFLRQGSILYRVRNSYPTVEGPTIAEVDQLDNDALAAVVFTRSTVNLTTDTQTTTSVSAVGVQTDQMKFYRFRTPAEALTAKPGDRTVFVPKASVTPAPGHKFTMLGATWTVLAVVSEDDAWALHARQV